MKTPTEEIQYLGQMLAATDVTDTTRLESIRDKLSEFVTPMPIEIGYQQRVIDEKAELDERAKKLSGFIGYSPKFDDLTEGEQERMKVQNDLMWEYSEVLGERIKNFS